MNKKKLTKKLNDVLKTKFEDLILKIKYRNKDQNHNFIEKIDVQFQEIYNNPKKYITNLLCFKHIIDLDSRISDKNSVFNELISQMKEAIKKRKQIIFDNFFITWWNDNDHHFINHPILITKKERLSKGLAVFDPSTSSNPDIVKSFKSLNKIIDFEMKEQDLNLLLTNDIMISYAKNTGYFLLFSKQALL